MKKKLVEVDNLCIKFYKNLVISDFSIDIFTGDYVLIKGRNGSGKTSLLRYLSGGLFSPRVKISGNCASFISISTASIPNLSVLDNIKLSRAIFELNGYGIEEMVDKVLKISDLDSSVLKTKFSVLSDGTKMRINFAISVLRAECSDYIVMDEWLSVGDPKFRERSSEYFIDLVLNKNKALILASNISPPSLNILPNVVEL